MTVGLTQRVNFIVCKFQKGGKKKPFHVDYLNYQVAFRTFPLLQKIFGLLGLLFHKTSISLSSLIAVFAFYFAVFFLMFFLNDFNFSIQI